MLPFDFSSTIVLKSLAERSPGVPTALSTVSLSVTASAEAVWAEDEPDAEPEPAFDDEEEELPQPASIVADITIAIAKPINLFI